MSTVPKQSIGRNQPTPELQKPRSKSQMVREAKDRSNEVLGNRVAKYELAINRAIKGLESLTSRDALEKVITSLKEALR